MSGEQVSSPLQKTREVAKRWLLEGQKAEPSKGAIRAPGRSAQLLGDRPQRSETVRPALAASPHAVARWRLPLTA